MGVYFKLGVTGVTDGKKPDTAKRIGVTPISEIRCNQAEKASREGRAKMSEDMSIAAFESAFSKLKHNREKVPLEQLQTRYATAYGKLLSEVMKGAKWFADEYIKALGFKTAPADNVGNRKLQSDIDRILQEEMKPGGSFDRQKAALIDRLDDSEFYTLVWQLYERLRNEAYMPYWNRHCSLTGTPGNCWIYNDIVGLFWQAPDEAHPDGCWIDRQSQVHLIGYPPKTGGVKRDQG